MKKHSKFEKDFAITLRYSTTPLEAFTERAAGGPRRAGPGMQSSVALNLASAPHSILNFFWATASAVMV